MEIGNQFQTNTLLESSTLQSSRPLYLELLKRNNLYLLVSLVLLLAILMGMRKKLWTGEKVEQVLILGPVNSGKTCLLFKLINGAFPRTASSQVSNTCPFAKGAQGAKARGDVTYSLTDFSGSLTPSCVSSCDKFIFLLDSSNRKSIRAFAQLFIQFLLFLLDSNPDPVRVGGRKKQVLLLGNKNDLFNSKNVEELNKLILLELELLVQSMTDLTDSQIEFFKNFTNITSLSQLDQLVVKLVSYSVKNDSLHLVKEFIKS